MTDPPVGASTWASGSHVWRGHVGSFVPKPARRATNRRFWAVPAGTRAPVRAASMRRVMLNVLPYAKNAKIPIRTGMLAANVNRKNLSAAYCFRGPPHTAMMKYIGTRPTSQNRKKRKKSSETNTPRIVVSMSRNIA